MIRNFFTFNTKNHETKSVNGSGKASQSTYNLIQKPNRSSSQDMESIANICVSRLRRIIAAMSEGAANQAITLFSPTSQEYLEDIEFEDDWRQQVNLDTSKPVKFAKWLIIIFCAFLLFCGAILPLAGAVVASGTLEVEGQNFSIQHQQGGLIENVFVTEGDQVQKGDAIIKFEDLQENAGLDQLTNQYVALKAREAILIAERDNLDEPQFAQQDIALAKSFDAMEQIVEQVREFNSRKARLISEESILQQRIVALEKEAEGLRSTNKANRTQLGLLGKEVQAKQSLLKKGLTSKSEFNALLRAAADLEGRVSTSKAAIGRIESSQIEAKEQVIRLHNQRRETASNSLNDLRINLFTTREQLKAARDILERKTVLAPADGVIIGLKANTIGSVIPAGQPIATLVPKDAKLTVDIRILPKDISRISIGDPATIRFTALSSRSTPEVISNITYISADSLVERATNQTYYLARVSLPPELPDGISPTDLNPGMPVSTFLGNEERSLFGYLLKPLTDSLSKTFREN